MLNEPLWIQCKICDQKSYNSMDVTHRYCGRCHKFHDDPSGYELGPTPESLPLTTGFSWTDSTGRSWHCPQPVAGHSDYQCDLCMRIIDDPMGPRTTTPEKITLMVESCRIHLRMEDRAILHRAIRHHEREMIEALMPHGGKIVPPKQWAQLILTCAREVLKTAEQQGTKP